MNRTGSALATDEIVIGISGRRTEGDSSIFPVSQKEFFHIFFRIIFGLSCLMFILIKKIQLNYLLKAHKKFFFNIERISMKIVHSFLASIFIFISISTAQSPYKLSWEKDGIILGSGAIVASGGYFLEQKINPLSLQEISTLSRNDVNAFDRSATYNWSKNLTTLSDVSVAVAMLSPLTLLLDKNVQKDFQTISAMYFETLLFATFIPSIAKGTSVRVRPFVYNADAPQNIKLEAEAKKSFFSGHTTVAFASAVFLSSVYEGYFPNSKYSKYVWGGSLLTASVVGYLRYASGNHYPTDILTGAVVGSAIGYLIPYFHKTNNSMSDVFPTLDHANGFSIHYVVQF